MNIGIGIRGCVSRIIGINCGMFLIKMENEQIKSSDFNGIEYG